MPESLRAERLDVDVRTTAEQRRTRLLDEVRLGLFSDPKVISPVWFYDERGSNLFDEITRLPEYYLTRAERVLLEAGAAEIAGLAGADTLVELGSGTSEKTRLLLDAMRAAGTLRCYAPVDVSEETLRGSAEAIALEYPGVEVEAIVGDFLLDLDALPSGDRRLVAFLGSTIGNLTAAEREGFFSDLHGVLTHDDWLLLGVDLVKDPEVLLAAYNDAAGVTAEFNRNALRVLNTELRAHFDPGLFEHRAIWDDVNNWIEMRLCSTVEQQVPIDALEAVVHFDAGEALRTEISAKFTRDGIEGELSSSGFKSERAWQGDGQFLLVLSRPCG